MIIYYLSKNSPWISRYAGDYNGSQLCCSWSLRECRKTQCSDQMSWNLHRM